MDLSLEMSRDSFRHTGLLGDVIPTVDDSLRKSADPLNPPRKKPTEETTPSTS
jgi:hypothetical protein